MNKLIFIVIIIALLGLISSYFLGDDNKIEQISEEIIKQNTGIEIDLSPNSPEKNK